MDMKHFKQPGNYGCGLYSLANVIQDDRVINEERMALSVEGNNPGQLTQWLCESGLKAYIQTLSYNNGRVVSLFDLDPQFDGEYDNVLWYPFFITVKSSAEKTHMIGCRHMRDGSIIVHDSLMDEPMAFSHFENFKAAYKGRVVAFEMLRMLEDNRAVCFIRK